VHGGEDSVDDYYGTVGEGTTGTAQGLHPANIQQSLHGVALGTDV
jgi:hypothetical protein